MKYLMIAKMKVKPSMFSEELLESSVKEWETALKLRGMKNVETVYAFADRSGGLAIGDADSEDQAKAMMAELPFYKYLDINLSPIISAEDALAKAKHDRARVIIPVGHTKSKTNPKPRKPLEDDVKYESL